MKRRITIGGCLVAVLGFVVVVIVLTMRSNLPGGAGTLSVVKMGITPTNPVEQAVEEAQDARMAVLSPLASTRSQSLNCLAINCTLATAVPTFDNLSAAEDRVIDNPAIAPGSGIEAAIHPSTNSQATLNALSTSVIAARNRTMLTNLFGTELAAYFGDAAHRVVSHEISVLNGTATGCGTQRQCIIVGAAGSEITKFTKEIVGGTRATVTVTLHAWQDDADYTGPSAPLSWRRVTGTVALRETLQRQADGTWKIVKQTGSFLPGRGP